MNRRLAAKLFLLYLFANLLILGWCLAARRHPGVLRVTFLDVGQGDAAILESPSGKVLVLDTGGIMEDGDDQGRRVVVPFLKHEGINHIDALLLTHPHADHIGGAVTLLRQFPVDLLMDNSQDSASPLVTNILEAAQARQVHYRPAQCGQTLDLGDGVTARLLAPTAQDIQGLPNDASIVLRVDYGRTAFLLTGDAEAGEEAEIVRSGQPLACDVLKAGHHGSHTSTTPEFLAAAHPRLAVISVGTHNLYGHPSPDVVERLHDSGVRVFRTDKNGAVTCLSDSVSVRAETMLP